MNFVSQKTPTLQLMDLSNSRHHSILIEGPQGCGKTYLAKQYATMLNVSDFEVVRCSVDTIRDAIDETFKIKNDVVICLENLDEGVLSASYTILKFLEEPMPNVYIVVTCRNLKKVPDTIISRSAVVSCGPPIDKDIEEFAENKNKQKFEYLKTKNIWNCVRSFKDAEYILSMNDSQIRYFTQIDKMMSFSDTVSNIIWKLGHYEDNTEIPVSIVMQYIIANSKSKTVKRAAIRCISDISLGRLAQHACLARFVFEAKYVE